MNKYDGKPLKIKGMKNRKMASKPWTLLGLTLKIIGYGD